MLNFHEILKASKKRKKNKKLGYSQGDMIADFTSQ